MRAAKMKERPSFQLMVQTDVQSIYHMQMPRWLFSDPRYCEMSLDAKVTYTFLLNRFQLSRRNGWVNERGEVFVIFPRRALATELRICEQRVTAAFKKLVELELVWEKRCGRGDANQIYLAYVTPQDDPAYTTHDAYELSYVPRPLPDGSVAICQEHVTDSLQALMKADYMLALNSGHNVRRCIICGRYFLLKSGVHALYCEGACPHAPGYTCRQFGSVEVQKELAKDIPKVKVKVTAFARITKDMQRDAISQEDARKAKDYVRDLLYDALRDANISVEAFEQSISSERVYQRCGITRTANPRGRPPKKKAGEQA